MPFRAFPEAVENLRLFSEIPEAEKIRLLGQGTLRHVPRGEYLFCYGDPIKHFYIVACGVLQLTRETLDGKEITTDISIRGNEIGASDIFATFSKLHRVSAVAVEDTTVLEFPTSWLFDAAKNPIVALDILSTVSRYAHMVELETEQKSTMSAAQRLGCFLQRLCIMHNFDPRGFDLPYSKVLIASRLGMNPETFSRTLTRLKTHGITVNGAHVTFHNIAAIEEFICEHCTLSSECSVHGENLSRVPESS